MKKKEKLVLAVIMIVAVLVGGWRIKTAREPVFTIKDDQIKITSRAGVKFKGDDFYLFMIQKYIPYVANHRIRTENDYLSLMNPPQKRGDMAGKKLTFSIGLDVPLDEQDSPRDGAPLLYMTWDNAMQTMEGMEGVTMKKTAEGKNGHTVYEGTLKMPKDWVTDNVSIDFFSMIKRSDGQMECRDAVYKIIVNRSGRCWFLGRGNNSLICDPQ